MRVGKFRLLTKELAGLVAPSKRRAALATCQRILCGQVILLSSFALAQVIRVGKLHKLDQFSRRLVKPLFFAQWLPFFPLGNLLLIALRQVGFFKGFTCLRAASGLAGTALGSYCISPANFGIRGSGAKLERSHVLLSL